MPSPSTIPHFNAEINAACIAAAELVRGQMTTPQLRRPCWRASYYNALYTPRGYTSGWVAWDEEACVMMFYPDPAIAIATFKNVKITLPLPGATLALTGGSPSCIVPL